MPLLKFSNNTLYPAVEEARYEVVLDDWLQNRPAHADATTLVVPNDAVLDEISEDVAGFQTVVLEFPSFRDGRAYSQARVLREQFDYTGEIRARGDIRQDQLLFMRRCGFDAFEFEGPNVGAVSDALKEFSFYYQNAADGAAPIWRQRRARAAAA